MVKLKDLGKKIQEKSDYIISNNISDEKCNKIPDMIEETDPIIMGQYDDGTGMLWDPRLFFIDNTIPEYIKIAEEDFSGLIWRIIFVQMLRSISPIFTSVPW